MHHPAHHRAQGKDTCLTSRRAAKKGHSMHSKEAALPREMQNHQHPCQPSSNDRAKPSCSFPRANTTASPHILPYIGRGTVKTTNPKHTPPTRNHPADKQTPPQHKAENRQAQRRPPCRTKHGGQNRHAQDHHPDTTARQTAEDRMQQ
ncbi:hypothetical protein ATANTOWER_027264 [Ataeniobius toweri]|uniref:Uncharacterized protein n=1 Tax=Ataeniobius toweri TaxID=208326 RepID=A0ABU7AJG8_9TELE|nr:hypothetical protein [Ataeniobius toweri]